ncbi:unnamed protein product [Calypogeia fissa]
MASSGRFKSGFPDGASNEHRESLSGEIQLAEDGVSANSPNGMSSADSENMDKTLSADSETRTESISASHESILDAVQSGDSEGLRSILGQGQVNVNEKESGVFSFAAIHHAATIGNEEVMNLLVNCKDIDLNAQDKLGRTALIIACKEGHVGIVRLLLERGADVLECAKGDFTCLHMASFCGHEAVVNLLLHGKRSREFWEKRDSGYLPLLPVQVRCELLEKKTSMAKLTALHMAATGNHHRGLGVATSIVEAFMAAMLEIHEFGPFNSDEIFLMINENWYQDFLLEIRDIINIHEGDRSTKGSRYGFYSPRHGSRQVTSMKRKYEGVKDYEALVDSFAALSGYVNAGDCMGRTALHFAAWKNRVPMVEFFVWDFQQLLSLGSIANVNAIDLDGYTPLHLAAWKGNSNVITALLLDARERYRFGLHDPELKFVADQFTLLGLENGENYHECNNLQPNAVANANVKSREVAAEVELGFESQDEDGQDLDESSLLPRPNLLAVLWEEERGGLTPLHYAVERKHAEVVELLLSHPKIDVFGESSDGHTPWAMAFPKGRVSETWNTDIPWMLRTGGRLLNRVPQLQNESQKLQVPPSAYKYQRNLVETAVSLAESESGKELSLKLTLYSVLEVQICLCLLESFMKSSDQHDQYRFPLHSTDSALIGQLGFGDLVLKGPSSFSHEKINDKLQKWEGDRKKVPWKLTLLHVTVYHGFHKELKRLLALPTFKEHLNARERITGKTALDIAVAKCDTQAVTILLQEPTLAAAESDRDGKTALEIAVEMQSEDLPSKDRKLNPEKWKGIEGLLRGRPDVQRYVDNLYRDRQVFVDAANAILVGAALIASVTFAGWLQPPLSYTVYYEDPAPLPAPPGTYESFAAVEQHASVRVFWAFNSLSFFSAVATVVAGAATVLPSPGQFIKKEVREVRTWLVFTSMLLSMSIFCVLGAFTAAGFAALPPVAKYRNNMVFTSIVGLFLCLAVLCAFLYKLYLTVKSRLKSNLKRCKAYLRTVYITIQKHK